MRILGDVLQYVPYAVCCALLPDIYFDEGSDDSLCTPSAALKEAYVNYWFSSYSACKRMVHHEEYS